MDHDNTDNLQSANSQADSIKNRRNLLKGMASAPVILSVASRPAWGSECSLSGTLSGNLSNHQCKIVGRSPDYWQDSQHLNHWPNPGNYPGLAVFDYTTSDPFTSVFGTQSLFGTGFTLLQALTIANYQQQGVQFVVVNPPWGGSAVELVQNNYKDIDRHAIAALLNAAHHAVEYPLTVNQVISGYQNAYGNCASDGNLNALLTLAIELEGYNTAADVTV
ncbi:MAG: hypothetical protein CSB48_05605 [Proteobacteria bacterium]|nr:MAG: hypothetical protein CSB48_05605 [Pseudomonadota bacterium]